MYEQLGVQEYWLFDPRGEGIDGQLLGYQLQRDVYEPITDNISQALQLRLAVEGKLIGFYRLDTGDRLLIPVELLDALRAETQRRIEAEERAEEERQRVIELEAGLAKYQAGLEICPRTLDTEHSCWLIDP